MVKVDHALILSSSCLSDLAALPHAVMKCDKCEVTEAQLNMVRLKEERKLVVRNRSVHKELDRINETHTSHVVTKCHYCTL